MSLCVAAAQQEPEWREYAVEGISYQVARTFLIGELGKPGSRHVIFVFLEPNLFTENGTVRVFRKISTQVSSRSALVVTIPTDKKELRSRLQNRRWESVHDDEYSRLTDQLQRCGPSAFKGSQIERYHDRTEILLCDLGRGKELCVGQSWGP